MDTKSFSWTFRYVFGRDMHPFVRMGATTLQCVGVAPPIYLIVYYM